MDADRLDMLQRHAEYGHLEGQDYDTILWLLAEARGLRQRAATLEGELVVPAGFSVGFDAYCSRVGCGNMANYLWKRGTLHLPLCRKDSALLDTSHDAQRMTRMDADREGRA